MREFQKKYIFEILETFEKAHEHLHRMTKKGQYQTVELLVNDCLEGAIQLSGYIRMLEGKETEAASVLENYRRLLMQSKSSINPKMLRNQIRLITNAVKRIPTQYEILFLPYKASMWDSMDGVWKAAKADSRCRCVVMPIPYCSRKPNRDILEIHYEGQEFPECIDITFYKNYDMAKTMPDVIYIHNPYDNNNYVTSVLPDYYSSELKKYTNMLVYVPYFVFGQHTLNHLCVTSGALYADKIIVQSDRIREGYLRECEKEISQLDWKRKVLALGSPKFDAVQNMDFVTIPEEWRERIGNRKVLFYNTTLECILNKREKAIEKYKSVFSYFKDRKDVVLLWRPHPLSDAVMEAMLPDLARDYHGIKQYFKDEKIGILDETPDFHRAIKFSDAYYGDASSMVWLYGITGKPILLQNTDIRGNAQELRRMEQDGAMLAPACVVAHKGRLWMASSDFNGLFSADENGQNVRFEGYFPDENKSKATLYSSAVAWGDKIVFAPFAANEIAIFHIQDKTFEKVSIHLASDVQCRPHFQRMKLWEALVYKEYVYFIPCRYPSIVRLDMKTNQVEYFSGWDTELEKAITNQKAHYFRSGAVKRGSKFYAASNCSNHILEFDMEECAYALHEIPGAGAFSALSGDGNDLWAIEESGRQLICWNPDTRKTCILKDFPQGYEQIKYAFSTVAYQNGRLILLPGCANMAIQVDVQTKKMYMDERFKILKKYQNSFYPEKWSKYSCFIAAEEKIYCFSCFDYHLLIIDGKTGTIEDIPLYLPEDWNQVNQKRIRIFDYGGNLESQNPDDLIFKETMYFNINAFADSVVRNELQTDLPYKNVFRKLSNNLGYSGSEIHKAIMEEIVK